MSHDKISCHCTNTENIIFNCINCKQVLCKSCFVDIIKISFSLEKCLYCDKIKDHSLIHCLHCSKEITEEYIMETSVKETYIKERDQFNAKIIFKEQTTESEESVEEIQECSICYDDSIKSKIVTCLKCNNTCCENCFQRYLLEKPDLSPVCMHDKCEKKLTIQNIIIATNKKWFEEIYKPYRSDLLMKIEKTQLTETIEAAKIYQETFYVLANPEYSYEIHENAEICQDVFGKGWEGFNFSANEPRPITTYKGFQFGCPNIGCLGKVIESVCNLCASNICLDCHEIIRTKDHLCNKDIVESIKAVFKESRPCPKCSALISKIEGCDQMFCTQCHTTYSWNTGELITGFVHNPHYFAWLDEQKKKLPVRINIACEEFISYERLISIFSHYKINSKTPPLPKMNTFFDKLPTIEHYRLAFKRLHANILHIRATSGNHANIRMVDNHDLRVKLISEEINEKDMLNELFKRDYDFHRYISYFNIYLLVFQTTGILFDNLWAYHFDNKKCVDKSILKIEPLAYMHNIYFQIQKILEYGNECLDYNNKCYGNDPLFLNFNRYPFQ